MTLGAQFKDLHLKLLSLNSYFKFYSLFPQIYVYPGYKQKILLKIFIYYYVVAPQISQEAVTFANLLIPS